MANFKLRPQTLVLTALFLSFSSCLLKQREKKQEIHIVSTTSFIGDLVKSFTVGLQISSESLMGPGIDPHMYRPQAKDLNKLRKATLIFYNGYHLEGKMGEALEAYSKEKKVIPLAERLPTEKLIKVGDSYDPHVWFQPELWIQTGAEIIKELSLLMPEKKQSFEDLYKIWSHKVRITGEKFKKKFLEIPEKQRVLITSHDAFQYFSLYFPLKVQAVQGISTESEVGLKKIQELIDLLKTQKIPAVFTESSVSPKAIEKISKESGAALGGELFSDALGPKDTWESTYLGALTHNLKVIYKALKNEKSSSK